MFEGWAPDELMWSWVKMEDTREFSDSTHEILWHQAQLQMAGETDVERQELRDAQLLQLREGIIRVRGHQLVTEPLKQKVTGRNEPCPCGSSKKFKKCCGK